MCYLTGFSYKEWSNYETDIKQQKISKKIYKAKIGKYFGIVIFLNNINIYCMYSIYCHVNIIVWWLTCALCAMFWTLKVEEYGEK